MNISATDITTGTHPNRWAATGERERVMKALLCRSMSTLEAFFNCLLCRGKDVSDVVDCLSRRLGSCVFGTLSTSLFPNAFMKTTIKSEVQEGLGRPQIGNHSFGENEVRTRGKFSMNSKVCTTTFVVGTWKTALTSQVLNTRPRLAGHQRALVTVCVNPPFNSSLPSIAAWRTINLATVSEGVCPTEEQT